ncbi:MAG: ABC transporter ATP-binding protein [Bryobacteraceae bacterium]
MSAIAIQAENLSKIYTIGGKPNGYKTLRETLMETGTGILSMPKRLLGRSERAAAKETFLALRDVNFQVNRGEVVGVIGRNGAGKSTLLKVLSRITEPSSGHADIHGRVGSLLEVGTGFHPELTGRENIYLNGAILGMRRADIERQFDAIVAFSEVEKFVDTPVKFYSSGMYLRLAFAVAAHLDPEILLVDEVLAVGDLAFQKKCMGKMGEVAKQGRTVLFVSHNMGAVRSLCEKGIVLERGAVIEQGAIGKAIETYYKMAAAAEKTDADSTRTGFGEVYLTSHEATTIQHQDSMELATTLNLSEEVAGFVLICKLEDMNQRNIFHLRRDSPEFRSGSWKGRYEIKLRVPPLWLEPGLYSLHFKVLLWGNVSQPRLLSDILHLDVGGECSGWGAVLTPQADWNVREAEPAAVSAPVKGEGA